LIFQYGIHVGLLNMPAVKKILDKLLDKKAKMLIEKILRRRR
jgi:recombinational DNA repair protein RecT